MSVWLPSLDAPETSGAADWRRGCRDHLPGLGSLRWFHVHDAFHDYRLQILSLLPGATVELRTERDAYVYVVDGTVQASAGCVSGIAGANDLVAVEAGQRYRLQAGAGGSRVYSVDGFSELI
jgi:hypothetical protein